MGSDANSVVLLLGVPYGNITFDHCHTHISVTLLIQALVVGPAPGSPRCKRVEFSPAEIRQAVEAGATLARRNESVHSEQVAVNIDIFIILSVIRLVRLKLFPRVLTLDKPIRSNT